MASFAPTNAMTPTHASAASRTRSNSAFIRELWSDEIVASYKANLVMPQLVNIMNHVGKKGDTIHVPRPVRGTVSEKTAADTVTIQVNQELKSQYLIDQHFEYSRLIEDLTMIQADDNMRQFYTDDAGYAMAKKIDTYLHALGAGLAGADATPTTAGSAYSKAIIGTPTSSVLVAWDGSANTNTGNAAPLTDEGIRLMIQKLDDSDVPTGGRCFVLPPVEKKNLLGVARFTEQAYVGEVGSGNSVRNGLVGDVYGLEVFVSSNCASLASDDVSTVNRVGLLLQREALLLIEQLRPRSQTQYKQEYLADLFTADMVFGGGILRPEAGIAIVVDS